MSNFILKRYTKHANVCASIINTYIYSLYCQPTPFFFIANPLFLYTANLGASIRVALKLHNCMPMPAQPSTQHPHTHTHTRTANFNQAIKRKDVNE